MREDPITADIGGGTDSDGDDVKAGVDNLIGGFEDDTLAGDAGANRLFGDDGDDTLAGGQGEAADGADILSGGDGDGDTATYATRSTGVSVTIDGGPNAEGDIVASSVENLTGGSGDDTLVGGGGADEEEDEDNGENVLDGGGGDDTLAGGDATGAERAGHLHRRGKRCCGGHRDLCGPSG